MQKTNNILLYLICLIPPALVAGPFIADGFVVLINILFFYIIFKTKKFEYFKNKFLYFSYFLLYFNNIFTSSENILYSLKSSLPYFRHGVFVIAMIYVIDTNKEKFLKSFLK